MSVLKMKLMKIHIDYNAYKKPPKTFNAKKKKNCEKIGEIRICVTF